MRDRKLIIIEKKTLERQTRRGKKYAYFLKIALVVVLLLLFHRAVALLDARKEAVLVSAFDVLF
jgi:hypothetical protein